MWHSFNFEGETKGDKSVILVRLSEQNDDHTNQLFTWMRTSTSTFLFSKFLNIDFIVDNFLPKKIGSQIVNSNWTFYAR